MKRYTKDEYRLLIKKAKKISTLPSRYHFLLRIADAHDLLISVDTAKTPSVVRLGARKNFLTNAVTALEIFFRDVLIENSGRWSETGFDELLKEKITLSEALQFAQIPQIRPEHIVSSTLSFKNPDSINNIFSKLIGKDFFAAIDKFEFVPDGYEEEEVGRPENVVSLKHLGFDWNKSFYDLYSLRNRVVHEDSVKKLSASKVQHFEVLVVYMSWVIQFYFARTLSS